jgi:hypothetical protein
MKRSQTLEDGSIPDVRNQTIENNTTTRFQGSSGYHSNDMHVRHDRQERLLSPPTPSQSLSVKRAVEAYVDGCLRTAVVKDKGRLRTVAMSPVDTVTLTQRNAIRLAVARKNAVSRDQRNGIEIQELEWQIAAAAEILCGRDTYVVTATGSGKTMCFQLALFARPGIIVVISPLLALMDDQVSGAAQLGIKAVQISEKTIKEDPELINRVRDGEFRLVFLQPEFCHASNGQWRKMTGLKTKFVESVFSIVIDEAHLIHQWRTFRTRYGHLASLRHTFNQASYMLCSATMMGYTRRFIHRTLNLGPNVSFIHRSVDRPNVYIAVKQIFEGTKDHRELYYLVPNGITHPAEIPQTIVFIDSRPDAKQACDKFWALAPAEWITVSHYRFVFCECSTVLSTKRRQMVMNAFRTGLCRILFATDVAGMGIDFPYVERVIQWRVGAHLSVSSVFQRLGRSSRRAGTQGVFILYYTKSYVITKHTDSSLAIFKRHASHGFHDPTVTACIQGVEAWANGTLRMTPPEDPLDLPVIPFDSDKQDDQPPISHPPSSISDSDSDSDGPPEHEHSQHISDFEDNDSNDEDNNSTASVNSENASQARQVKHHCFPTCCRGITWLINTSGCRRAVLLSIFDDAGFVPAKYSLRNQSLPTCCDSHLATFRETCTDNDAIRRLVHLLPPDSLANPQAQPTSNDTEEARKAHQNSGNCTRSQRIKVRQALQELRLQIWEELAAGSRFMPYSPQKFLPDTYIERIISMSGSLSTVNQLKTQLATGSLSSLLDPFLPRILAAASNAYAHSATPAYHPGQPLNQGREESATAAQQEEVQNPYALLQPGSIATPASGIPANIYDSRSIPTDLRNILPSQGRGRPSKAAQSIRQAIIRSYWVARGYQGE